MLFEGYVFVSVEEQETGALSDGQGHYYRKLHEIIAERLLGRKLREDEVVHHIDGNKENNEPDNLLVMTRSQHSSFHATVNNSMNLRGKWSHDADRCIKCGSTEHPHYALSLCTQCYRRFKKWMRVNYGPAQP